MQIETVRRARWDARVIQSISAVSVVPSRAPAPPAMTSVSWRGGGSGAGRHRVARRCSSRLCRYRWVRSARRGRRREPRVVRDRTPQSARVRRVTGIHQAPGRGCDELFASPHLGVSHPRAPGQMTHAYRHNARVLPATRRWRDSWGIGHWRHGWSERGCVHLALGAGRHGQQL